jgi:hypothetical protein
METDGLAPAAYPLLRWADGMTFDADAIFEEELSRRGFSFVRESEHEYRVDREGWKITANLANVRRNAERDQDPDAIRRFVDRVLDAFPSNYPAWTEASTLLLWSAEPPTRTSASQSMQA